MTVYNQDRHRDRPYISIVFISFFHYTFSDFDGCQLTTNGALNELLVSNFSLKKVHKWTWYYKGITMKKLTIFCGTMLLTSEEISGWIYRQNIDFLRISEHSGQEMQGIKLWLWNIRSYRNFTWAVGLNPHRYLRGRCTLFFIYFFFY